MRRIETELRNFIDDNFLYGRQCQFSDTDSFMELGFIDSTGMLELVNFIEQRYGITLEDSDLVPENLDSIAQLTQFIQGKTVPPPAAAEPAIGLWQSLVKAAR